MTPDDVVDAMTAKTMRLVNKGSPTVMYGTWIAAESNSRYSQVNIDGLVKRNVGKLASVTGLVPGSLCIIITGGSVPLIIIGTMS